MPAAQYDFDAVVLGGGPGGLAAATGVARLGGKACLVEAGHLGGVCLNVGCIPTKAMLAAAAARRRIRRGEELGLPSVDVPVDGGAFLRRVRGVVETLRERTAAAVKANRRIELVAGTGGLVDAHTVLAKTAEGERRITARAVVLATGAEPARPGFAPWDSPRVMTTDEALAAADLPAGPVVIVGGGVIGCEFATVYAELGIPVTVVEMLDRLLGPFEPEAGEAVAESLAAAGAEVLTGRAVAEMAADAAGVTVRLDDGRELRAGSVLLAVGRRPRLAGLGLEALGLAAAGGVVEVDDRCRTGVEGVYAVGDVAETRQYAHLADRMGRVAAENIMGRDARDDRAVVPAGVYTHPEVAAVGLTAAEAKDRFGRVRVLRYSLAGSGMALACAETAGGVKVVADGQTGAIHGALWIGAHATDLVQEFAVAMRCGLTLADLAGTIHPHPTFQEAAAAVADAWAASAGRARRGTAGPDG